MSLIANISHKLAIGTVQFGMNYGISNLNGQTTIQEAKEIISISKKFNITTIDTASAYGNSEETLGNIGVKNFDIVTKIPEIPNNIAKKNVEKTIINTIEKSFEKLKIEKIYAILIHKPEQLFSEYGNDIYKTLEKIKNDGLVEKIGISSYNPEEIIEKSNYFKIDIAQVPYNIVDQRLTNEGMISEIKKLGIEIHVRSIFLQGLLLSEKIPSKFEKWGHIFENYENEITRHNMSKLEACLNFALKEKEIDKIVIGINNKEQLLDILNTKASKIELPREISSTDTQLINPSYW